MLAREAIASFVDDNSAKLNRWLDEIEEQEGPRAAFDCFSKLVEHHVPKLSRSETTVSGDPNNPLINRIEVVRVDSPAGITRKD